MFPQGLIKGLRITGRRQLMRGVCEMYPQRPKTLPPKSRTFLSMKADAAGAPACKACMTCQQTCPDHVISIERDPDDRKRALTFTVDSGRCTFCGMCEEACPFDALAWTGDFERATYEKGTLTYRLIFDGLATESCVTVEAPAAPAAPAPATGEGAEDAG